MTTMTTINDIKSLSNYNDRLRATLSLSTSDKIEMLEAAGYSIDQATGGHYRLFSADDLIHDDSVCEDVYELESAVDMFFELIVDAE